MFFTPYGYSTKNAMFGGGTYIYNVASHLREQGHEAVEYVPKDALHQKDLHSGPINLLAKLFSNITYLNGTWKDVKKENPDYIVVSTSFSSFMLLLTNFGRRKIIHNHADSFLDLSVVRGDNIFKRMIMAFLEWFYCVFSDYTFTTMGELKSILIKRYRFAPNKIKVIPFGVNLSQFHPVTRKPGKIKKFAYIGGIGYRQDIKAFISLLRPLWNRKDLKFIFMGRDESDTPSLITSNNIQNMAVKPPVSHEKVRSLLEEIDIGVVVLKKHPAMWYSHPSKTWEYMAAGKPILAYGPPDGVLDKYVNENKLGVFLHDNSDVIKEVEHLLKNYNQYSVNCLKKVKDHDSKITAKAFLQNLLEISRKK